MKKKLPKGTTATLVLKVISRNDCYGYDIIKQISSLSNDSFRLKQGTLYPILHSLEKEELIESYWQEQENQRKRKYYKITKSGLASLQEKQKDWLNFRDTIDGILVASRSAFEV